MSNDFLIPSWYIDMTSSSNLLRLAIVVFSLSKSLKFVEKINVKVSEITRLTLGSWENKAPNSKEPPEPTKIRQPYARDTGSRNPYHLEKGMLT